MAASSDWPSGVNRSDTRAAEGDGDDFVRNAIAGLQEAPNLNVFLGTLLEQPLRAAGTGQGAVVLLEGDQGREYAHRIVILEAGKAMSTASKEQAGLERIAMTPALRVQADRIDASEDGALSYPDDPVFAGALRDHLHRVGVQSVYTMALRVGDRMIGWFAVGYQHREAIDEAKLVLLRRLADQMTIAFTVARLVERAKQAALADEQTAAALRQGDNLVRANRSLKNALDSIEVGSSHEATLGYLLRVIADETESAWSTLCFRDGTTGGHIVRPTIDDGGSARLVSATCPEADSSLWPALDETQGPMIFGSDPADAARLDIAEWMLAHSIGSILAVPLFERAAVVGALLLAFDRPRLFGAAQLEMLQVHAHQLQLALRLQRASTEAERKAALAATLAERSRVARDLSETLSQGLTGILMHLRATRSAHDPAVSLRHVQSALDAARTSLIQARRTVQALRGSATGRASFGSLLRGVLQTTFAGSTVSVCVDVPDAKLPPMPLPIETELLLIAQEFATNTLKHASARTFHARIAWNERLLSLSLRDDGRGFDGLPNNEGFGLAGMRERAACIGAALVLQSASGSGTVLTTTVRFMGPTSADLRVQAPV